MDFILNHMLQALVVRGSDEDRMGHLLSGHAVDKHVATVPLEPLFVEAFV
jgi:hypothetical protein